jgi:hypothetical protein
MHLLIPFSYCLAEGCASALPKLKLPQLEKLLARLTADAPDQGDEFSLSTPHERALARALGLPTPDGLIPWAAHHAQAESGAAFITPCHWQAGSHQIAMGEWPLADFSEEESRALMLAMQPYFEEDGITLQFDDTTRWLAHSPVFDDIATASLDRVAGRNLENWMPRDANAAPLRRLQNEMQMLLYTHPVNEARSARRVPVVNSFWLSGTGRLNTTTPAASASPPIVIDTLRQAALKEDWSSWKQAWQQVDANECTKLRAALDQGEAVQVTLCGERHAQTFQSRPRTLLSQFKSIFGSQPASNLLNQL